MFLNEKSLKRINLYYENLVVIEKFQYFKKWLENLADTLTKVLKKFHPNSGSFFSKTLRLFYKIFYILDISTLKKSASSNYYELR